jgi:hypothetical protein
VTSTLIKPPSLIERARAGVQESATLDKAVARLAGVLYPIFTPPRVSVLMDAGRDRMVVASTWSAHPTRLVKGLTLQAAATPFPELLHEQGVLLSPECERAYRSEFLCDEGVTAWAVIPIPRPWGVEGMLCVCGEREVLEKSRLLLIELGLSVGGPLAAMADATPEVLYAREALA